MGMRVNAELPLPADLKNEYPLSDKLKEIKAKRDAEIRDIFTGKSDKFVVIIGPCSADNEDSVCEYVNRLAKLNDKVSDRENPGEDIFKDADKILYYVKENGKNGISFY